MSIFDDRARRPRVETDNNLLGALAKDYVIAGRSRLEVLNPSFGGLQASNDFNPFEIQGVHLLQNVEEGFQGGISLIWLTGIFLGSRVLGTDMRFELLIALLFVVHLHVVK